LYGITFILLYQTMIMKRNSLAPMLICMVVFLSSCELVGDILEFGIWIGVILVLLVIGIIFWIIRKIRR
jgi:hypothetical protein